MSLEPERKTSSAVDVIIEDLQKSYDGLEVLRGINLRIAPREICVVMGTSGCGKSVLLRQIIGLERPDHGRVLVASRDVSDLEARRTLNLAMVFQSSALFNSMTVAENVALWLQENRITQSEEDTRKIVEDALNSLGLEDTGDKLPAQLSGGMRKRVAIARALVMNPSLILYDEPTAELDPIGSGRIAEIIRTLKEKMNATSIVVTHDRELAFAIADHVAILHEGKIIEEGTPGQIRASQDANVQKFLRAGHKPAPLQEQMMGEEKD